ncbi:MAG: hypothetical protein JO363_14420 [Solirubrobacterales bacterium]|nr:hypothetical protein [Solirubrobacterales bacterium]
MNRRYQGVRRGCGAPTAARGGKGDAYEYCKQCHPGAIAQKWTRERVRGSDARGACLLRQPSDLR